MKGKVHRVELPPWLCGQGDGLCGCTAQPVLPMGLKDQKPFQKAQQSTKTNACELTWALGQGCTSCTYRRVVRIQKRVSFNQWHLGTLLECMRSIQNQDFDGIASWQCKISSPTRRCSRPNFCSFYQASLEASVQPSIAGD